MEITLEEIQKKFESLPENLKWAIMAVNIDDKIIDIGKAQGLNVEQMGQLSLETHMEIFGFTSADKFEESIKNSLKLPDEKTRSIVDAINEKILKEIREKIGEPDKEEPKKGKESEIHQPQPSATPKEENKQDSQILNQHGIEIVPGKLELPAAEKITSSAISSSTIKPSILAQKLSGSVATPTAKTEHSLPNISPSNTPSAVPKVDPYREIPE